MSSATGRRARKKTRRAPAAAASRSFGRWKDACSTRHSRLEERFRGLARHIFHSGLPDARSDITQETLDALPESGRLFRRPASPRNIPRISSGDSSRGSGRAWRSSSIDGRFDRANFRRQVSKAGVSASGSIRTGNPQVRAPDRNDSAAKSESRYPHPVLPARDGGATGTPVASRRATRPARARGGRSHGDAELSHRARVSGLRRLPPAGRSATACR